VAREIQTAALSWAGLYCLILAAWKLATGVDWSWWRVLLPLWLLVAHNLLYMAVGFVWVSLIGSEEATVRESRRGQVYQLGAIVCELVVVDNLLRRLGGPRESAWWWLASGRSEVIGLFAMLAAGLQLLYWRQVIARGEDS